MTDLVQRAKVFATQAYRQIDHRRKYTNKPYEVHLKSVAAMIARVTGDQEMIAAAWLHDTVEDTPATIEELTREFGPAVSRLVEELTDVSRPVDGNRAVRKAIDRDHLAAASPRAMTIKLADLIDNCRDICTHDPRFGRVYLSEAGDLLRVLGAGDPGLYRIAQREVEKRTAELEGAGTVDAKAPSVRPLANRQGRTLKLLREAFSARELAEPLALFDGDAGAEQVAGILSSTHSEVAGVTVDGRLCGYVDRASLQSGRCRDFVIPFTADQVVPEHSSLTDVIEVLTRRDRCFVTAGGAVSGYAGRSDMQKPLMRMWLFGIVTLIEMEFVERIRAEWPEDGWIGLVSAARLEQARELQGNRARMNQPCELLDCLQLADKAQILLQDERQLRDFGFGTASTAKRIVRELQSLRNNLAHAQDIVRHDWPQIVRLARRIEEAAEST